MGHGDGLPEPCEYLRAGTTIEPSNQTTTVERCHRSQKCQQRQTDDESGDARQQQDCHRIDPNSTMPPMLIVAGPLRRPWRAIASTRSSNCFACGAVHDPLAVSSLRRALLNSGTELKADLVTDGCAAAIVST
jgi:hypothetical protein